MTDDSDARTIRGFVRWAMQPPQAYVMYLIALVLVGGLSFYAGSLKPKTAPHLVPQTTAPPQSK